MITPPQFPLTIPEGLAKKILEKNPITSFYGQQLKFWAVLRQSGGNYPLSDAIDFIVERWGFNKNHVKYKLLPKGDGLFWRIINDHLIIIGEEQLANKLGIPLHELGTRHLINKEQIFEQSLQKTKALLHKISVPKYKPISKATISNKIVHYSEQTLINWEKHYQKNTIPNILINDRTGEIKQVSNSYKNVFPTIPAKKKYRFKDPIVRKVIDKSDRINFEHERELLIHIELGRKEGWLKPGKLYIFRLRNRRRVEIFLNRYKTIPVPNEWVTYYFWYGDYDPKQSDFIWNLDIKKPEFV